MPQTGTSLARVAIAALLAVTSELARRPAPSQPAYCPVQPAICDNTCPALDLHPVLQQLGKVEEIVDNKVTDKVSVVLAFGAGSGTSSLFSFLVWCCCRNRSSHGAGSADPRRRGRGRVEERP